MEKDYLCRCNRCGSILIDMNPQVNAEEMIIPEGAIKMELVKDLGDIFPGCPKCKTDEYLMDLEWVVTDPSNNQRRITLNSNLYMFEEDRLMNPETKETYKYGSMIDLTDYSVVEMIDHCSPFGYTPDQVKSWLNTKHNLDLIAECIFEMEVDYHELSD